jgi:hypothetical protein
MVVCMLVTVVGTVKRFIVRVYVLVRDELFEDKHQNSTGCVKVRKKYFQNHRRESEIDLRTSTHYMTQRNPPQTIEYIRCVWQQMHDTHSEQYAT